MDRVKHCYYCKTKERGVHPQYKLRVTLTAMRIVGIARDVCQFCKSGKSLRR